MHADALIAIAAARNGERLTREIFGGEIGWIPWQRPGFDLGLKVEALVTSNPKMNGLVLGSHGLITWAATGKACYETTLRIIQQAADWLDAHGKPEPFGPTVTPALDKTARESLLARIAPGAARHAERADQQGAALSRHARRARIRRLRARAGTGREGDDLSRSFPAHEGHAALRAFRSGAGDGGRPAGEAAGADRAVSRRLHRVLRALQASELAGDARSVSGAAADPRPRPAVVPEGQVDGARRGGVLRQHDQRDALGRGRRRIRADRRAGSVRHRILAARGSEAAAPAEAESRSKARSRSSPAAPAASAPRPRAGCWPMARRWC